MSHYQVLARKWRPRNFPAFVGQEHVVRALTNALNQQRLHHAYLFTGTRGVGKTTLARILAKCLNCDQGVSANPCGECNACIEIDNGRFVDLIEVDAASRTKVEDTRELLENVQYAPAKGRYKIYLIDEVHMLSGHSFNALLKTLEEPPPHVKFLLATTDPQKLPITILSRCLQFHLKNLSPELITNYLIQVLQVEKISGENAALALLARAANGSMRDALSLLDQAIAYSHNNINTADIKNMLGTIEQTYLIEILTALVNRDAHQLLTISTQLAEQAADFTQILEELLMLLHQITLAQVIPTQPFPEAEEQIKSFAKQLTGEEIQLYYQIGLIGRRDLPLAPTAKSGFEMILLRMLTFRPDIAQATFPSLVQSSAQEKIASKETTINTTKKNNDWKEILTQLNLTSATRALAAHCSLVALTETTAQLALEASHQALLNDKHQERLSQAFTDYFKRPMTVTINTQATTLPSPALQQKQQQAEKQQAATVMINQDQNIQAILSTFNATILPDATQAKD